MPIKLATMSLAAKYRLFQAIRNEVSEDAFNRGYAGKTRLQIWRMLNDKDIRPRAVKTHITSRTSQLFSLARLSLLRDGVDLSELPNEGLALILERANNLKQREIADDPLGRGYGTMTLEQIEESLAFEGDVDEVIQEEVSPSVFVSLIKGIEGAPNDLSIELLEEVYA